MSARSKLCLETLESRETPSLTPVGAEFRVNAETGDFQWFPSVATSAAGNFITTWHGYNDALFPNTGYGVTAQRFDSNGLTIGDPVNVSEADGIGDSKVACDQAGNFIVTWTNWGSSGPASIFARRFTADGLPLSSAFRVNQVAGPGDYDPDISIGANGTFAVTWTKLMTIIYPPTGGSFQVSQVEARIFAADGSPLTGDFVVASNAYVAAAYSSIAVLVNNSVEIIWCESYLGGGQTSYSRQFNSNGLAQGAASSAAQWYKRNAEIVPLPNGNALIAWVGSFQGTSGSGLFITSLGETPVLTSWPVNTWSFSMSVDSSGCPVIGTIDLYSSRVYARRFHSDLTPDGPIVQLNTDDNIYTTGTPPNQRSQCNVAVDADGDGMAVWYSWSQPGGTEWDVYARRFIGDAPGLRSSTINNGEPTKSEVKSTSLTFTRQLVLPTNPATAFTLTGPTGTIPVSVDSSASTPAGANLKLTFPTYPNGLPNGRYTLRGLASLIHDTAGQALDGNGDGVPGDDYLMNFHRLAGDFDGDGTVATSDFILFRLAFGSNDSTFDLDGDGTVNASDFVRFRLTFGSVI